MLLTPSPVTNCHTFSDPLPPSSVTYFMDGPLDNETYSDVCRGIIQENKWTKPEKATKARSFPTK